MQNAELNSVCGPLNADELGKTLLHEHLFTFHSDMLRGDYSWKDELRATTGAIEKLRMLKAAGYSTLVDMTIFGLGRDVRRVAEIAEVADFNVIAASGIYSAREMPVYFRKELEKDPLFIEDLLVREVTVGIGETGIKSGVLKCVIDAPGLTADVDYLTRCVARAHARTGVAIITHSDPKTESGAIQQRILLEEDVDLSRVVIGHCGDTDDLRYLETLILAGSYVGMDRFGHNDRCPFETRVKTVAELCARGYASRVVMSHDTNCGGDVNTTEAMNVWRYGHIERDVIPALLESGVTADEITQMMIENPRNILVGEKLPLRMSGPSQL